MNYYQPSQMNRCCQSPRRTEPESARCQSVQKAETFSAGVKTPVELTSVFKKSIAMAYVPWQKFEDLYPNDVALSKGTLFCQLDLPFRGRR